MAEARKIMLFYCFLYEERSGFLVLVFCDFKSRNIKYKLSQCISHKCNIPGGDRRVDTKQKVGGGNRCVNNKQEEGGVWVEAGQMT